MPALVEPVTLDQAKQQVEVLLADHTYDALLTDYIAAAREYVENRSGHILIERDLVEYRACFGEWIETKRPITDVLTVGYSDADGNPATVDSYVVAPPNRIYPDGSWPTVQAGSSIRLEYTAGYPAGDEPRALLQAIKMLVAHWFSQRESVAVGLIPTEVPHAVDAICDQIIPGYC